MSDVQGKGSGAVNFVSGAVAEVAKRNGANWAQNVQSSGMANSAGHKVVAGAAIAGVKVAAVVAAAPVAAAAAGVLAVGAGIYGLYRWLK